MLPSENMLIYKYAPSRHRSLIFGIKFVITFGAAPASVALVAFIQEATDTLSPLFAGLAAATLVVALLMIFLPLDKPGVFGCRAGGVGRAGLFAADRLCHSPQT